MTCHTDPSTRGGTDALTRAVRRTIVLRGPVVVVTAADGPSTRPAGAARVGTVVLQVGDLDRAASFWTAALGYTRRADPTGGASPVLEPADGGPGPSLTLDTDDRAHLDLFVPDEAAQRSEVRRLLSLGARRVDWADTPHVVLADPEGNLFCVVVRRPA